MGWAEFLIDVIKLSEEVKRINNVQDRLQASVAGIDKRVVRLETMVEMAGMRRLADKDV